MPVDAGAVLAVSLWLVVLLAGLLDLSQGAGDLVKRKNDEEEQETRCSAVLPAGKLTIHFLLVVVVFLALSDAVQVAVRSSQPGRHAASYTAALLVPSSGSYIKTTVRQAAPTGNPVPMISPPAAAGGQPTSAPFVGAGTGATAAPPASATAPGASGNDANGAATSTQPSSTNPNLERCKSALERMLAVLLIEIIFELFFVIIRCILSRIKELRRAIRKWLLVLKIAYAIPVLILNVVILWLGAGPNGACSFGITSTLRKAPPHIFP
jgi:hypothetical protein